MFQIYTECFAVSTAQGETSYRYDKLTLLQAKTPELFLFSSGVLACKKGLILLPHTTFLFDKRLIPEPHARCFEHGVGNGPTRWRDGWFA